MASEPVQNSAIVTDPETNVQYEIDTAQKLGVGNYGSVFAARRLVPVSDVPLAVKVIPKAQKTLSEIQAEAKLLQKPFKHVACFSSEKYHFLFMERVPGQDLIDILYSKEGQTLSFASRVRLLRHLVEDLVNGIHSPRSRGAARVHGDVKPENAVADIDYVTGEVKDARFVDFGGSFELDDKQLDKLIAPPSNVGYTPGYVSPEAINDRKMGFRSDNRSFGFIVLMVFGVQFDIKDEDFNLPYKYEGLFDTIPGFPEKLREVITAFIQRMGNDEYSRRPTDEEILRFFVLLDNYCVAEKAQPYSPEAIEECVECLDRFCIPFTFTPSNVLKLLRRNVAFDVIDMEKIAYALEHIETFSSNEQKEFRDALFGSPWLGVALGTVSGKVAIALYAYVVKPENRDKFDNVRLDKLERRVVAQSTTNILSALKKFETQGLSRKWLAEKSALDNGELGEKKDDALTLKTRLEALSRALRNHVEQNIEPKNLCYFNAERRAARKLAYAIEGGFFKGLRVRYLNQATEGTDENLKRLVGKLGKATRVAKTA